MELTKLKALELCYELWNSLAETGDYKGKWSGWKRNGGKHIADQNCFACEYGGQNDQKFCYENCILAGVWKVGYCDQRGSLFYNWDNAKTPEGRKKYARIIADGCMEEIKKLKKVR